MQSPTKRIQYKGYSFDVCEEVYEPAEDTFLFADNLDVKEGESVLDMGTGTGILAVLAAEKASSVLAVDINPFALLCAKQNAINNKVNGKISFLQGDLFQPLSQQARFDLILFNSPYLPSEESEEKFWLGRAWAGGKTGRKVIDRFISQVATHLRRRARILLLQSTLSNVEKTKVELSNLGFNYTITAERSLPFFEKLKLITATITK